MSTRFSVLFVSLVLVAFGSGGLCPLPPDAAYGRPCVDDDECGAGYACAEQGRCVPARGGGDAPRTDGGPHGDGGALDDAGAEAPCEHEGVVYEDGAAHPAASCLVCALPAGWVPTCGEKEICGTSGCEPGCIIAGASYPDGARDPERPCWGCAVDVASDAFTPVELDVACDDEDACTSDTFCDGLGSCVPSTTVDCSSLNEACAVGVCAASDGSCGTSSLAAGTGCGDGLVCDGEGACLAGCFIGGVLYEDGEASPGSPCSGCVAAVSTTSFSPLPSGTDCGGDLVCDGVGSCGPSCVIDTVLYPNGASDPLESCRFCDSAVALDTWQERADDTPCEDDDNVCTTTACVSGACTSLPLAADTPCGAGVCDGAGVCSAPQTLLVVLAGTGLGAVSSSPPGVDCGADCDEDFVFGTDVTLTATPDGASSLFVGWSGACSGTGTCTVDMTRTRAATATFALLPRDLLVEKQGAGTGTVTSTPAGIACGTTCGAAFDHGTSVTLSALATSGTSVFSGWSGGGCTGTAPCVVTMDAAKSVSATFVPAQRVLSLSKTGSGGGVVTSTPAGIDCGATCSAGFDHGASVTLSAAPDQNSTFTGFSGGGCSGTGACTVTMSAATSVSAGFAPVSRTLTVTRGGSGSGTVTSSPAGIDCGATCSAGFSHGASVTLTATPAANNTFSGWSGSCTGTGTCVVTLDAARSVTATFQPVTRTLTVSKAGAGTGTVTSNPAGISCGATCSAGYSHGTSVTLTAAPDSDNRFAGWSGGGCSGTGTCTVSMSAATTVTATFEPAPQARALTVNKSGAGTGTVTSSPAGIDCGTSCSTNFANGTAVTLTATAGPNSTFSGWSGSGCSGVSTCVVTMDAAKSVTATFVPVRRTLSVTKGGTGDGTVTSSPAGISCPADCGEDYDHNTSVTLTATAGANSTFTGWSGSCSGTGSCVVTMDAARSVTASFALVKRTLSVTTNGNGAGTVTSSPAGINCPSDCGEDYDHNTSVTLTATAGANSTFTGWSGSCSGTGSCVVTMDAAKSVTASFALVTRPLSVSKTGTGTGTVTSSPSGINCGATCAAGYDHGTVVTLTASPGAGSGFAGWSGACSGMTCSVTMSAAASVTATFNTLASYNVDVCLQKSAGTYGTVSSSPPGLYCSSGCCSASFTEGTTVELWADGSFQQWSGDCALYGSSYSCTLEMTSDRWVSACFSDGGGGFAAPPPSECFLQ